MASVLLTLSTLPFLAIANTTPSSNPRVPVQRCGFIGDDNTYGLGLRLGLYAQWLTTSLANNFVPEEAITMRGVNNCFQLSTFAGLLYITFARSQTQPYAVEAFLVLLFCIGGVSSGRGLGNSTDDHNDPHAKRAGTFSDYRASTIGGLVQLALATALVFYGIWFIYVGMDGMAHPSCSRVVFFFAKVDLFHWFRTLLKIGFTFAALSIALLLIVTAWGILAMIRQQGFAEAARVIFGFNEEPPATVREGEEHVTTLKEISFGYDLVLFILATELLIRWNHIGGVGKLGSTGQLVPLVVGGSGLVRVCYKMLFKLWRRDYKLADSFTLALPIFSRSKTVSTTTNGIPLGMVNLGIP